MDPIPCADEQAEVNEQTRPNATGTCSERALGFERGNNRPGRCRSLSRVAVPIAEGVGGWDRRKKQPSEAKTIRKGLRDRGIGTSKDVTKSHRLRTLITYPVM